MKTTATTSFIAQGPLQLSPQLHLEISFLRPIEPRHALFALRQGEVKLVYEEKYCSFKLVSFHHAEESEISSLQAFIDLDQACFHQGQFFAGQTCELTREGDVLAIATIVEVKHPVLRYWDWHQAPTNLTEVAVLFSAEQMDCFLTNLEFELLDLGFTKDYVIHKPKAGEYALEIRLYSTVEALDESQARRVLEALRGLPYTTFHLKPNFYQLDAGEHLENFECSFIIGDLNQFVTGRLTVI